ncbi:MAG: histidinol-phosphate transaminase [Dehalococcoidia bacterium]|nr:histidinol-phosphate transaminase [Dehalococcoidia bacterium]
MTTPTDRLVRPHLQGLQVYEPIEPPEVLAQRLGIPVERIVKLNGNENPYGPSPRVQAALRDYQSYHIYPDPFQRAIRDALASYTGLDASNIVAGSGCDELIDLLLRLTLAPGDEVIDCVPTFGMYAFGTRVCGGRYVPVPRDQAFQVDVKAVKAAITPRTKVIFVCSPNNPTGNLPPEAAVEELLKSGVLVVVDETYYEFSRHTFVPWIARHDNLVVLRSFSKWAGLASLRVGYGLMAPALAAYLMAIKPPYLSSAAQVALLASLEDKDTLLQRVDAIVRERERLFARLRQLPGMAPVPSAGNFLLCRVMGKPAAQVNQELVQRGIFIRYFDSGRLKEYLRITVGRPDQSDAVVSALQEILR